MPAPKSKSKLSVLARHLPKYKKRNWLDDLTNEQARELNELRRDWHAGVLKNNGVQPSISQIWRLVRKEIPSVTIGETTFKTWIGDTNAKS